MRIKPRGSGENVELLRVEFRCADEVLHRILEEDIPCKYRREHPGGLKVWAEGSAVEKINQIHTEERDRWLYGKGYPLTTYTTEFTTKCRKLMQVYVEL